MFIIKNNTNKLLEEYEEIFDEFLYNLNKDFINFKYEQGNDVLRRLSRRSFLIFIFVVHFFH
jgi:hypothetical protein